MTHPANNRTGGQILIDQLVAQGADHVFCVPGESYLAALDAMHGAPLTITVCRQEAGAAMMAIANARLVDRPGICFVTRGPGATNAAHGVHIAQHDSVPLILFVGQVERGMIGRGAFQEMDYAAFFGSTTKWATQIEDPARIPEIVQRAYYLAMQGRPGPVVIALPEDVLTARVDVPDARFVSPAPIWPGQTQMAELQKMLAAAERPIAIIGGGGWSDRACAAFQRFAERFELPVAASFRRASLFDGDHPNYAGEIGIGPNPKLKNRIASADLVLLVGGRMAEMPSQAYTLFEIPTPRQTLVHVHPDPAEIGRVYHPTLGILATSDAFCAAVEGVQPPEKIAWNGAARQAHDDYLEWSERPPVMPGPVDLGALMVWLRGRLPEGAIITNGAGNYATWPGRFLRYGRHCLQVGPTSGSMGFGVPAAIGAKRTRPQSMVVSFNGDGCFLMNGQEFATAVQYGLPIVFVVVDNAMYGTIRMHQEREYPTRITATELKNPDFAAYARAFGGHGETVETTAEFAPAFERALASGRPAILHVKIDPDVISPTTTLTAIRKRALAARE
jgi:acetolactate synthase-1/2/3 large subunit